MVRISWLISLRMDKPIQRFFDNLLYMVDNVVETTFTMQGANTFPTSPQKSNMLKLYKIFFIPTFGMAIAVTRVNIQNNSTPIFGGKHHEEK